MEEEEESDKRQCFQLLMRMLSSRRNGDTNAYANNPELFNKDYNCISQFNEKTANGFTPLLVVLQQQNIKWTKYLLEHGADPNISQGNDDYENNNTTPLILASIIEDPSFIELLIRHGARINDMDKDGTTALDSAIKENFDNDTNPWGLNLTKVIKFLKEHGAKTSDELKTSGGKNKKSAKRRKNKKSAKRRKNKKSAKRRKNKKSAKRRKNKKSAKRR
jgi:ankyrin repeat protein